MNIDYNIELYNKLNAEYDAFIADLKTKSPDEILEKSYEKVIKQDFIAIFEFHNFPQHYAKALYMQKTPLDNLYHEWLENEYSYLDLLRDTVDDAMAKGLQAMRSYDIGGR